MVPVRKLWLPRSPYLTPRDFCLQCYIKERIGVQLYQLCLVIRNFEFLKPFYQLNTKPCRKV